MVNKYFSVLAMDATPDFYLSHGDLLSFLTLTACPMKRDISYLTTR
jgi:hypothetical protein